MVIEVRNLTKRYGSKLAVDDISFTVGDGEALGFLGPNGAGKTTTMNIITGYLSSNEGSVTVSGTEIFAEPMKTKAKIGYLPEQPPLYPDMTVWSYLRYVFDLKKVKLPKAVHIEEICRQVNISDVVRRKIKNLSKGYRQRVGLAQAMLGEPEVLVLDEPTIGLDPHQIIEIRSLIKELKQKHTIILSSHILSEVQASCDRVIVIHKGKLIADGKPEDLSRSMNANPVLIARIDGPSRGVAALLSGLEGISHVERLDTGEEDAFDWRLDIAPGSDARRGLFAALAGEGWPLLALSGKNPTLEDVFLQLTEENTPPEASTP
ncbi:MAG: ABC transporter ATP-binding protein [Peptococcaceae bacterium]|nr:ABC transporter ATP-binding protein [Peptococcaceae bacterium]